MDTRLYATVLMSVIFVMHVNAYGRFKNSIPNGNTIKNPCSLFGLTWSGVGHRRASGGGSLNMFGTDFENEGAVWTHQLCLKDSDGDGMSNGHELGDPNCVWTVGQPVSTESMGHPGICEPVGSQNCQHQMLQC